MEFNQVKQSVADRTRTENYEGGESFTPDTPELALYKVAINNLLEDTYYREDTQALHEVRQRFDVCANENPEFVLKLAAHAREEMYLRDISQLLLVLAANDDRTKEYVREYAPKIMQRADEPTTVKAMHETLYDPVETSARAKAMPKPLKKGINDALHQWDAYQFAKYDTDRREHNLRDILNVTRPNPRDEEHAEIFERLIRGPMDSHPDVDPLETPKTWEATISEQGNTPKAWREVLPRLGMFAKIRNVRNMIEAGLSGREIFSDEDMSHVRNAKVYPFRFYQAMKALRDASIRDEDAENWLSRAIDVSSESLPDDLRDTFVAVDLSGSMNSSMSMESNMTYKEIGVLFGAILMSKDAVVGGFGNDFQVIHGHNDARVMDRMDAIRAVDRQVGNSTNGWKAIDWLRQNQLTPERIIVFTDMQIWDSSGGFYGRSNRSVKTALDEYRGQAGRRTPLYMVDLNSYGDLSTPEGYDNVFNISGWNENVLDFIQYAEEPSQAIDAIEAAY